jgi:hypothetical protein
MTAMLGVSMGRAGAALCILCLACGCHAKEGGTAHSMFDGSLAAEAYATQAAYTKAVNAGTAKWTEDIPPAYWAKRIKELHPLRVYNHRANIVVVQKVADHVEEGKYIWLPISSYIPRSDDDGFEFGPRSATGTVVGWRDEVLDFHRYR